MSRARAMAMRCRCPPDAALPDNGIVPLRQVADKAVGLRVAGGGLDLVLGGVGFAVGDVLAHEAGKEQRLLQHDADLTA